MSTATTSTTVSTTIPTLPTIPTPTAPPSTMTLQSTDLATQLAHMQALMTTLEGVPSVPTDSSIQLVPSKAPRSDAPPQQTMDGQTSAGQETSCLDECCDWCCREVCTLENACCLCACACKIICCCIRARLGIEETERGMREGNPFRVAAGLGTLGGNNTATAITIWDRF